MGTIHTKEKTDVVTLTASLLLFDITKKIIHSSSCIRNLKIE